MAPDVVRVRKGWHELASTTARWRGRLAGMRNGGGES
jgi:hypothetical protein